MLACFEYSEYIPIDICVDCVVVVVVVLYICLNQIFVRCCGGGGGGGGGYELLPNIHTYSIHHTHIEKDTRAVDI